MHLHVEVIYCGIVSKKKKKHQTWRGGKAFLGADDSSKSYSYRKTHPADSCEQKEPSQYPNLFICHGLDVSELLHEQRVRNHLRLWHCHLPGSLPSPHTCSSTPSRQPCLKPTNPSSYQHRGFTPQDFPNRSPSPGLFVPTRHSKHPQVLPTPKDDCPDTPLPSKEQFPLPSSEPFLPLRQLQACSDPPIS